MLKRLGFNTNGVLVFLIGEQLGFIIDIICGTGGSETISLRISLVTSVIALILCLMGIYEGLIKIKPDFNKILLLIVTTVLTIIELLVCYLLSFFISMIIVAPIMLNLGYHVTMP